MNYTRTAVGLLSAQYCSVLKKCFLINMGLFALGLLRQLRRKHRLTTTKGLNTRVKAQILPQRRYILNGFKIPI